MDRGRIVLYIIFGLIVFFIVLCWMQYKNPQDMSGLSTMDMRNKFGN
ncbi:MAG: hypothetical protein ABIA97_06555 [Candidatus Omnitrophota bacterium]